MFIVQKESIVCDYKLTNISSSLFSPFSLRFLHLVLFPALYLLSSIPTRTHRLIKLWMVGRTPMSAKAQENRTSENIGVRYGTQPVNKVFFYTSPECNAITQASKCACRVAVCCLPISPNDVRSANKCV